MRFYLCGGAPVPSTLIERAAEHGFLLCELYGSTESCPHLRVPRDKYLNDVDRIATSVMRATYADEFAPSLATRRRSVAVLSHVWRLPTIPNAPMKRSTMKVGSILAIYARLTKKGACVSTVEKKKSSFAAVRTFPHVKSTTT